jgi:Ran GTPase-activating protein (RanGAP) involved in mRNA processing and transport
MTLDLSGNGITATGAVSLAAGLTKNVTLRSLCLDFNACGPVGAAAIAAALPSTELESLDLEWNGIRCAGAAVFALTLQQRTSGTLRHLGIASNSIRAGGAIMLAGALRNSGLVSLVLAHNTDLGHTLAGATVAAAVATCASLKHLDVTACGLDADAMTLLCHALEQPSCALVALRAGGNPAVGQSAVHSLARAAARNSVLRELCFTMVHNECPSRLQQLSTDVTLTRDPEADVGHWVGAPHARTTPWHLL